MNGEQVRVEVWDTGGQERFRTITKSYYERAVGVMLVYDCGDEHSFADIQNWIKQIEIHSSHPQMKVLVAAKCDLAARKVTEAQGQALAKEFKMQFVETSAKTGMNVSRAFQTLAELCLKNCKCKSPAALGAIVLETKTEESETEQKARCCKGR